MNYIFTKHNKRKAQKSRNSILPLVFLELCVDLSGGGGVLIRLMLYGAAGAEHNRGGFGGSRPLRLLLLAAAILTSPTLETQLSLVR
jgi:hypothetical protein